MTHGGNIYAVSEELGIGEDKIIDFSASINPLGMPRKAAAEIKRQFSGLGNYPDPESRSLRRELALRGGLDPETILCGNGSTELIYLLPRALRPRTVLIPRPTFTEYERACRLSGSRIRTLRLRKQDGYRINPSEFVAATDGADMAFLCNPNNPTGHVLKKDVVLGLAASAKKRGCLLVVDEAFIDFCPSESVIGAERPNLAVLGSLTKFFALAGLRVGFGVFPGPIAKRLRKYREPWAVNMLAERAGAAALRDKNYAKRTLRLIAGEKKFLEDAFQALDIGYYPSDVNYYLLEVGDAVGIRDGLLKSGIMVRHCGDFKGLAGKNSYLRVAVKSRRENEMLIKGLSEILNGGAAPLTPAEGQSPSDSLHGDGGR